ncbi:hypothetical protein [Citrobacter freundii]|uniref:hypothetical protein n=1 Tax=Citrobacter freundii TaxID=546 RepID=UPI00388DB9F5
MLQARLAVELQILRDELLSGHYQPLPARAGLTSPATANCDHCIPRCGSYCVQRAMLMGDGADMGE